ncbi:hypothetical protein OE88DRAFT_1659283 [Heliocybe sulcata]|uniref:Uncharacterized protein n=1 Tax=Heliocybe sulcata TaxID=5364 RepID=A0A5C3NBU7_9AGAM|nr:hypothetical protein OE88DRAFT_1659283 [Heliocybe sulcata]
MDQDHEERQRKDVWVDRYDARLLLSSIPTVPSPSPPSPALSASGWSDLPSDAEDTFFLTGPDLDDYHRQKRRRVMDTAREERLRALGDAEGSAKGGNEEEEWGDSDEEPDEPQKDLMRRTAAHLSNSPNPAQLEMRILANHGADKRFAFLRGRWARAWRTVKARVRMEKEGGGKKGSGEAALGGLAGYGESDGDEDAEDKDDTVKVTDEMVAKEGEGVVTEDAMKDDAEVLKAARRAKAKEWAAKRRTAKEAES